MKRANLPLNALRVFDAAERHLSFARAADELAVTPAAVGQQIRALEDVLGVLPFVGGRPSGQPIDVLTGFLAGDKAMGRPVGVQIAGDGSLLVADDVGGVVWRVNPG